MPLTPIDQNHALQIQAGTVGRRAGHAFEDRIAMEINTQQYPLELYAKQTAHVAVGRPSYLLLEYISNLLGDRLLDSAIAISTGALATSEEGRKWLEVNGTKLKRCKSDVILTVKFRNMPSDQVIGVSIKQCNNWTPTNAQLYFTTAQGFSHLLYDNGIIVSEEATLALRQFCGEVGYRPLDRPDSLVGRQSDPRRYFWEEIEEEGRKEWEDLFTTEQDTITRLLLQKAYLEDPFIPEILLHKTKKSDNWEESEVAIYTVDELVKLSRQYSGFNLKPYSVRKGTYRDPAGVMHLAPRFGIIQMQRGGQFQHPTQLQFNLEARYFYKLENC